MYDVVNGDQSARCEYSVERSSCQAMVNRSPSSGFDPQLALKQSCGEERGVGVSASAPATERPMFAPKLTIVN